MISAQAAPADGAAGARTRGPGAFAGFGTWWALLLSLAGGLALYAAFPPVDAWPLAVAGPAMLVLALTGRGLRVRALSAATARLPPAGAGPPGGRLPFRS